SIIRRDLIPKMFTEPHYLTKNRIRVFDSRGREIPPQEIDWGSGRATGYKYRQDSGDGNALGTVRINFPNSHQVYMHDTPMQSLFGEEFRFHSAGCVRVQNVRDLVTWLLAGTRGWGRPQIDEAIEAGGYRAARLSS